MTDNQSTPLLSDRLEGLLRRFQEEAETYGWSKDQGSEEEAERDERQMQEAKRNLRFGIAQAIDSACTGKTSGAECICPKCGMRHGGDTPKPDEPKF